MAVNSSIPRAQATSPCRVFDHFPPNVGILAMEIYFPRRCIKQTDLEIHDGMSTGKYTIGLGQQQMAFCDDREDINSISLTVVKQLMEKYNVSYNDIGRLEVGTETIIDKSKSVKTHLMEIFAASGNMALEGIATTNACYGGTSALFNALQWVESSYWDGRYALVVAADIAIYASGPARPTSGVGAVAMLIGPNAPLVIERGLRGTHMEHVYDFYKPNLSSEFPQVDGHQSVACYMRAIDNCYQQFTKKLSDKDREQPLTTLVDYAIFHSPYAKIVQKAAARLFLNDFLQHPNAAQFSSISPNFKNIKLQESYFDKDVEKAFVGLSSSFFEKRTDPSLYTCKQIGNMYCASLYGSLISLLASVENPADLTGRRILAFSYGSGLASSMFSIRVVGDVTHIIKTIDLQHRLDARTICTPKFFEEIMDIREKEHNAANYQPVGSIESGLFDGAYYLDRIDEKFRRSYVRK